MEDQSEDQLSKDFTNKLTLIKLSDFLQEIELDIVKYNDISNFSLFKERLNNEIKSEELINTAKEIFERLTFDEILDNLEYTETKEERFIRMNNLNDLRNLCYDICH